MAWPCVQWVAPQQGVLLQGTHSQTLQQAGNVDCVTVQSHHSSAAQLAQSQRLSPTSTNKCSSKIPSAPAPAQSPCTHQGHGTLTTRVVKLRALTHTPVPAVAARVVVKAAGNCALAGREHLMVAVTVEATATDRQAEGSHKCRQSTRKWVIRRGSRQS